MQGSSGRAETEPVPLGFAPVALSAADTSGAAQCPQLTSVVLETHSSRISQTQILFPRTQNLIVPTVVKHPQCVHLAVARCEVGRCSYGGRDNPEASEGWQ